MMERSAANAKADKSQKADSSKDSALRIRPIVDKGNELGDPLQWLVQPRGCRGSGCSPSLELVAQRMASLPAAQRRQAAMALQRSRGNRFMQTMAMAAQVPVQAKMMVWAARDEYERSVSMLDAQPVQRQTDPEIEEEEDDEEVLQGKFLPAQRASRAGEGKPQQGMDEGAHAPAAEAVLSEPNRTGMPDCLKAGIESLSGIDMSDVRVHANSDRPARLNALAYTQGNQIYLGPGQERHLPHEAWHAVQQKQGRVKATGEMNGEGINDEPRMEIESDIIGEKAVYRKKINPKIGKELNIHLSKSKEDYTGTYSGNNTRSSEIIQCKVDLTTLDFYPDSGKDTIIGILNKDPLKGVYKLPGEFERAPRKGLKNLDRAKTAEAIIEGKKKTKRGEANAEYKDIGALGRWEKLACTSSLSQKTQDVGHLIADEFFDDDQKDQAYVPSNLAVQDAIFNEQAYREIVETPIEKDLETDSVKINVSLEYLSDLTISINDLIDRKALDIVDEGKHNLIPKDMSITIPRRMPSEWKVRVERKNNASSTLPDPSYKPLSIAPDHKQLGYPIYDPGRSDYTPSVRFDVQTSKNDTSGREHIFRSRQVFEDPSAKKNPAKMGANPESGRYTSGQIERAKKTKVNANKHKFNTVIIRKQKQDVTQDVTTLRKRQRCLEIIDEAPPEKKKNDLIDELVAKEECSTPSEASKLKEEYKDAVFSEDEVDDAKMTD